MQTGFNSGGDKLRYTPQMGAYTRYHPLLGYEIDPDVGAFTYVSKPCVKNSPVTITPNGTRTTRPSESIDIGCSGPRIAVLGDSMMMAREVGDYEHFSAILQKLIPRGTITNFGTAGYSTVQEYIGYSAKVDSTNPDIVVLAFLDSSDPACSAAMTDSTFAGV